MEFRSKYIRIKIEIGKVKPKKWDPELKEWLYWPDKKSEGLGDTIYKITKAIGIKWLTEKIFPNGDCGCNERQQWLNHIFPYK